MSNLIKKRKIAVVANFLSVILILIIFYGVRYFGIPKMYLLLEIFPFFSLIINFKIAFGKSNLWKITHTSFNKLDEREMQLVYKATTDSYSIFTILCLVLVYTFSLLGLALIDVIVAACLLYIAHILPASIIAWNEKIQS
jgi:hypothetical protein